MCNASSEGAVYANVFIQGDLLGGAGSELVGYQTANNNSNASAPAENLCWVVGNAIEDMRVVATVNDGLGDFLVWLANDNDELWMCNASSDARLYSLEPVDFPLNDDLIMAEPVQVREA